MPNCLHAFTVCRWSGFFDGNLFGVVFVVFYWGFLKKVGAKRGELVVGLW
jgi:hypothetical protein